MKNYQDTETGDIHAFDDGIDPFKLNNRHIPKTLSETVIPKPSGSHVWFKGKWIKESEAPVGYKPPVSSVPAYNPAWISFLFKPGTVVLPDKEEMFEITLEQINKNTYNGKKLSEIALRLSITNNPDALPALISYDGGIAIPIDKNHRSAEIAVDTINRILGAFLLGGIRVEAKDSQKLEFGSLEEGGKNIFSYMPSEYARLRYNWASKTESIVLLHPQIIRESELRTAYCTGHQLLNTISNFSPIFLLRGQSALYHRNVSDALSNLWIVVEQLTCFFWEHRFLCTPEFHPKNISSRLKSFKDNRTWTTSVKHELLWQTSLISEESLDVLSKARKLRNELAHKGDIPDCSITEELWIVILELLESASGIELSKLRKLTIYSDPKTSKHSFKKHHPPKFNHQGNTDFEEWSMHSTYEPNRD